MWGKAVYHSDVLPTEVPSLQSKDVVAVTCGEKHAIALSGYFQLVVLWLWIVYFVLESGRVYSFGWGIDGRLGLGDAGADKTEFCALAALVHIRISHVDLGSGHSLALAS